MSEGMNEGAEDVASLLIVVALSYFIMQISNNKRQKVIFVAFTQWGT